jgi:hypothetical protein
MKHLAKIARPVLAPLLLVLMAGGGTGCVGWGSSALPPRLTSAEEARVQRVRLPLTVGVERYEAPAYSDSLRVALQRTKLFERVDDLERFATPPSLVARVERRIYGSTAIPVYPLLTFGIIPMSVQETAGESFSLSPTDHPEQLVKIECTYRGRTTLGWIALLDVFHPDRTVFPFDPEHSSRFRNRLKLSILEHEDALAHRAAAQPDHWSQQPPRESVRP